MGDFTETISPKENINIKFEKVIHREKRWYNNNKEYVYVATYELKEIQEYKTGG